MIIRHTLHAAQRHKYEVQHMKYAHENVGTE